MARFIEVARNRGVDSLRPGSEWMMVPQGGSNLVCLDDGAGYDVAESRKTSKLKIKGITPSEAFGAIGAVYSLLKPGARIFQVGSHAGGEAIIEAKKGGLTVTLDVTVHPKLTFKVAFFFLQDQDSAGRVQARTVFKPSDADAWIDGLNDAYGPQANMWFEKGKSEFLPLKDLAPVLGTDKDLEQLGAAYKTSGAPIGVFLAGPQIVNHEGDHPYGFFHHATQVIVVKDQIAGNGWDGGPSAPMLKTIAHEIGHYRNFVRGLNGTTHDYWRSNGYMSDILNTLDGTDIKIPKQRVLHWNPW